jgi:hypothetical protein
MWWAYTQGAYIRGGLIVGGLRYQEIEIIRKLWIFIILSYEDQIMETS